MTEATRRQMREELEEFDVAGEAGRIAGALRMLVGRHLNRRGMVVGVSGGVDSAVCLALAVRALGSGRVLALMLPERDSSPGHVLRARRLVSRLMVDHREEDLGPALEAIGCYRWRDEAIREVFPRYGDGWKNKIVIAGGAQGGLNYFQLVVSSPEGRESRVRLPRGAYLQIVAATNYKQRLRKAVEYFHADRMHYAVVGTPNRLEYDQGFFVKNGDGAADVKPIAHLYKSQVYALARHLGISGEIVDAPPSTDTYSLEQGQDEFYFGLGCREMDAVLWCSNHGVSAGECARWLDMDEERVRAVFADITAKRRTTACQHWPPLLVEPVAGPLEPPAGDD